MKADRDRLLNELEGIGLTEYQSRAYVAAVTLGTAPFSDLADESGIPQQRIYDVVDDLDEMGLVEVHEGSGGKEAVAPPPETTLAELKERRIDEFSTTFESISETLQQEYNQVEASHGFITAVNHESSVKRHVRNAIQSAEWWLFLSLSTDMYEAVTEELRGALDRNVTVRLLIQSDETAPAPDSFDFPEGLVVRQRPIADTVVAADREYGVFRGVSSPSVVRSSLVTRDENIVEMLQRYSEQFWAASRPVQDQRIYPRRYLTAWRAIVDIENEGTDPTEYRAYVEGHDTVSGVEGSWTGRVVDLELDAFRDTDFSVVLPEVARLSIETDDGVRSVGGWDATLEDVAAHGLELRF